MQKMEEKRKSAASPVLSVKSGPAVHVKAAARRSLRCCSLKNKKMQLRELSCKWTKMNLMQEER